MRLSETCACGAKIEIEDDEPESVRADVKTWRTDHRHIDGDPWRRDMYSSSGVDLTFGFVPDHQRPAEVTA